MYIILALFNLINNFKAYIWPYIKEVFQKKKKRNRSLVVKTSITSFIYLNSNNS